MPNQETLCFIRQHADADVRQLALQGAKYPEVDMPYALQQIAGRQMAKTKLPAWAAMDDIVYPPHLSMEQCSSEWAAKYKASLAGKGRKLVDLTGGFGVDFAFMAEGFQQSVYIEQQPQLCAISSENFKTLGLHAEVVCADAIDYLHALTHADLIFIDPARRNAQGERTYGIADCTPNVVQIMPLLTAKSDRLLLKLSPMLDWRKAVADIESAGANRVSAVHIVSVANECKELLVLVEGLLEGRGERGEVRDMTGGRVGGQGETGLKVVCVNLQPNGIDEIFEFCASSSNSACSASSHISPLFPLTSSLYKSLLLPNASVMKAGCFDALVARFGIRQLSPNSHLFLADKAVKGFPGRQFSIIRTTSMNKRQLKEALAGIDRANIAVRNFPLTADELRKKLKMKDGGEVYIFGTTVAEKDHKLYICRKIEVV